MLRRLSYTFLASLFFLGFGCGKKEEPPPPVEISAETLPETKPTPLSQPETRPKSPSVSKKIEGTESQKAEEEGPFEHTGTVMKKGFIKAGSEMKKGFKKVGREIKSGFE